MNTKIAVIGSATFLARVKSLALELDGISVESYPYNQPQEAPGILKRLKPCDAVFFSGALPYFFSKTEILNLPIPSVYLAQDEISIATSMLSVLFHKNISPSQISIDAIDSIRVLNVLEDLEIETSLPFILDYSEMLTTGFNLEKITDYHRSLWKKGCTGIALTGIHAVYDQLVSEGIPAMRMIDPKSSLIKCLEEASFKAHFHKRTSAQVAAGYIQWKSEDGYTLIQEMVRNFADSVQKLDDHSLILYCTRRDVESFTENNLLLSALSSSVEFGFGYGATLLEAKQNAQIALHFSTIRNEERSCYIFTEEKMLLGPFPKGNKQHSLKMDDPAFIEIARTTKLGPVNLSKVIEFGKSRTSNQFTAGDLAAYLQVTRRSTERILKKLHDNGYVKVVGEEMTYHQGRPRAIYELNIPIY